MTARIGKECAKLDLNLKPKLVDRQYHTHESDHYYWNEDHWDMDKLFRTLPFNLVHQVASIPFDRGRPDKACWRLNISGEFSLKSACNQHIQILHHTRLLKHNHWKGDRNLANLLEYRFHIPQETTPILVHWLFPSLGWLELNTDGAAKANPGIAGAGCIIRDHTGSLRPTFYEFLGEQTNVYA
ncbi:hypothetical protein Sango_1896000 [Sesamum angolense]|uniref:RNase H type-1 domain-containing protein n=1 Tax=Sesamum angolense TaxID=2727404 RepID=A0AAE1WIZ1_9LAMI|nr:hypothetical protein Sango_1896000 [Sesamum angolense]